MLLATDTMLALHRALRSERMAGHRDARRRTGAETAGRTAAIQLGRTVAAR